MAEPLDGAPLCAGERIVGPQKTLFLDEISTGLDSSTTFQIVQCMRNFSHLREVRGPPPISPDQSRFALAAQANSAAHSKVIVVCILGAVMCKSSGVKSSAPGVRCVPPPSGDGADGAAPAGAGGVRPV